MQKYETIFVIDSLLKAEEIEAIITKYERFISANGGEIDAIEKWGKKRLAYEIKKRQYGYYVLIRFEGLPTMIKTLEREYRLNESLLRYKTLVMPKSAISDLQTRKEVETAEQPTEEPVEPAVTTVEETDTSEQQVVVETDAEKIETNEAAGIEEPTDESESQVKSVEETAESDDKKKDE